MSTRKTEPKPSRPTKPKYVCPEPGCGVDMTARVLYELTRPDDPVAYAFDAERDESSDAGPVRDSVDVQCPKGHWAQYRAL